MALSIRTKHSISFLVSAGFLVYLIFLIIFLEQSDDKCNTTKGDRAFLTAVEVITFIQAISVVIELFANAYTITTGDVVFKTPSLEVSSRKK